MGNGRGWEWGNQAQRPRESPYLEGRLYSLHTGHTIGRLLEGRQRPVHYHNLPCPPQRTHSHITKWLHKAKGGKD